MVGSGRGGEERKGARDESGGSEGDGENWAVVSILTEEEYKMVKELYDVAEGAGARRSKPTETALTPEPDYVAIYKAQLKNGLRFSILGMLGEVIKHYGVSID